MIIRRNEMMVLCGVIMPLFMFFLCSCRTNDEALIRNGYLDIDKSLPIGKAFDGYKYFKSKSWKAFKSDNGKRMVQFEGSFDLSSEKVVEHCLQMLKAVGGSTEEAAEKKEFQDVLKKIKINEKFKSLELVVQFTINPDKRFEIKYMGIKTNFMGQQKEQNIEEAAQQTLKEIYYNQPLIVLGGLFAAVLLSSEEISQADDAANIAKCQENLTKIDSAKEQWALENKLSNGTEIPDSKAFLNDPKMFGPNGYESEKPICPSGGTYTVNSIGENPKCSIPNHTFPE